MSRWFLMPDVDEIIDGLRRRGLPVWAPSARLGVGAEPSLDGEIVVPLADAKAAVRSAVDARTAEIVDALNAESHRIEERAGIRWTFNKFEALRFAAAEVARRFPNGGTNDGQR